MPQSLAQSYPPSLPCYTQNCTSQIAAAPPAPPFLDLINATCFACLPCVRTASESHLFACPHPQGVCLEGRAGLLQGERGAFSAGLLFFCECWGIVLKASRRQFMIQLSIANFQQFITFSFCLRCAQSASKQLQIDECIQYRCVNKLQLHILFIFEIILRSVNAKYNF